jgi:hypothetical protein
MYRGEEAMLCEEIVLVCEPPLGGLRTGCYARVTPLWLRKVTVLVLQKCYKDVE